MIYKKIVDEYITSDNIMDMFMLTKITEDFICDVKEINPEIVEKYILRLKMYLHPFKDRECSEYAVSKFDNEDGTKGAHWDYETTSKVAMKYDIDDKPMFHYVLNMIYSDLYDSHKSDEDYIKDAIKFIDDKDAPEDKAEKYYRAMHY